MFNYNRAYYIFLPTRPWLIIAWGESLACFLSTSYEPAEIRKNSLLSFLLAYCTLLRDLRKRAKNKQELRHRLSCSVLTNFISAVVIPMQV